jgi:protein pelota
MGPIRGRTLTRVWGRKAMSRFYGQVYQAVDRHFDLDQLKVIIIASPGFTKEAVFDWIFAEAAVEPRFPSFL